MKERSTSECMKCGARVRIDFESRWKHLFNRHPEVVMTHILPILADPEFFTDVGRTAGTMVKNAVRRFVS